ncbi:MAG: DUF86 domain-containing protein [Ruminococcus sp.]|nr:DUF86 domain-containing protein [Ruminococcus sp.]
MNEHDKKTLLKIKQHALNIKEYSSKCFDCQDFCENTMISDACVFNLLQIGELTNYSLSNETKQQMSTVPWKEIYGMRNRIVHGYEQIDIHMIWSTIQNDIPVLVEEINKALNEEDGDDDFISPEFGRGR